MKLANLTAIVDYMRKRYSLQRLGITIATILCLHPIAAPALDQPSSDLVDGAAELQKLLTQVNGWSDYTCLTEQHNFKPNKITIAASKFFYKKGPVVRIEVVGGGFRDGSVVVRSRDGKITGKGGGLMGCIQMTLDPDSRMLILPSGINVMHADFPELVAKLNNDLAHGFSSKMSSSPVTEPDLGRKVFGIEIHDNSNALKAKLFLSAEDHLPLRWDIFRADGGKTQTYFKNLRFNTGLSDDLFNM